MFKFVSYEVSGWESWTTQAHLTLVASQEDNQLESRTVSIVLGGGTQLLVLVYYKRCSLASAQDLLDTAPCSLSKLFQLLNCYIGSGVMEGREGVGLFGQFQAICDTFTWSWSWNDWRGGTGLRNILGSPCLTWLYVMSVCKWLPALLRQPQLDGLMFPANPRLSESELSVSFVGRNLQLHRFQIQFQMTPVWLLLEL